MAAEHPTELTLLAFVEGELEGDEHVSTQAHLAVCPSCAADVALARQGREAARAAPLLELPAETRGRMLAALPPQRPERRATGRRWLAVVAPIAAALALVGGITTLAVTSGGGDSSDGAAGEAGATAEDTAGGGSPEESEGANTAPSTALKGIVDTPRELAKELRRRGYDARVENGTVVVRTSKVAKLERLLGDYPRDAVRIETEP